VGQFGDLSAEFYGDAGEFGGESGALEAEVHEGFFVVFAGFGAEGVEFVFEVAEAFVKVAQPVGQVEQYLVGDGSAVGGLHGGGCGYFFAFVAP